MDKPEFIQQGLTIVKQKIQVYNKQVGEVSLQDDLVYDWGIDSLGILELSVALTRLADSDHLPDIDLEDRRLTIKQLFESCWIKFSWSDALRLIVYRFFVERGLPVREVDEIRDDLELVKAFGLDRPLIEDLVARLWTYGYRLPAVTTTLSIGQLVKNLAN